MGFSFRLLFTVLLLRPALLSGAAQVGDGCSMDGDCGEGLHCDSCGSICTRIKPTDPKSVEKGLPFNRYSWLTTHNSYALAGSKSATGSDLITPTNQQDSVSSQLQQGFLPTSRIEARALKAKAARYFIWEGFIYRKSFSGITLKCVYPLQVPEILKEVHSGECGSHSTGHTLTQRILHQDYYWPSVKKDALAFAKKCQACQLYGKILHQSSQELQPIISPWPFAVWCMDFVGPFPTGSGQRKILLVLVDYFTKWVEAVALAQATTVAVIKFLSKEVFPRFGTPMFIITDNDSQFTNLKLKQFCSEKGVTLKFASVAHPQTNG